MSGLKHHTSASDNHLLATLPLPDRIALERCATRESLAFNRTLAEPGAIVSHVYFPLGGILSTIAQSPDGSRIEVGITGREGFTGTSILMGADLSPHQVLVQMEADALRIASADLLEAAAASPALHTALLRFAHVFSIQTAYTALANGSYTIERRLARWLLMYFDRVDSFNFMVTHDFLSLMLAVRRSGVTDALHVLEGQHLIQSTRGNIRIMDRAGLETFAGGCYGAPEREYERLFGLPARHDPAVAASA
jgi:CRP-like cAMP-binding protein